MDAKQLRILADELFAKKLPLNSLWQEIADNFYAERADFTVSRNIGTDFASNLVSSYPLLCRRELGDHFGTMLRPTARPWFHPKRKFEDMESEDNETKQWLEWFERGMRLAMYDPMSSFTRATKEGDHDFASFGQLCISVEHDRKANVLLYRCWHLRDMAWEEDERGKVGAKFRRWKPSLHVADRTFGDKLHPKMKRQLAKTPFAETDLLHIVVPAELYDKPTDRPYWSVWYDCTNEWIIEEQPLWGKHYIIPRWQTVSGSQYAYAPATVCALPDARLLQAMTFSLLEAGERAANPPMVAKIDAVRQDMALYAGGVTWVESDTDERHGQPLYPIEHDYSGMTYGLQMNADTRALLHKAFYLDALTLPQRTPEMTAYEVGQRVQEYIRNALPLFEPMENDYSAELCQETFGLLWRGGTFGPVENWPRKLRQQMGRFAHAPADLGFAFETPLHDAIEQMKGQKFQEAAQLIAGAISLDPTVAALPKAEVALRDALSGIGVPAKWMHSESEVQQAKDAQAQKQRAAEMLGALQQGSEVAKNLGQSGMVPTAQTAGAATPA